MRISDWSSDVCSSDLLAEVLAEEVVQAAILVGEDGDRRIVAHRADRLLLVLDHRMQDQLQILHRPADRDLTAAQRIPCQRPRLVEIGRASCRERVCQYVWISVGAVALKKKKCK